jgi:hypothetical protein
LFSNLSFAEDSDNPKRLYDALTAILDEDCEDFSPGLCSGIAYDIICKKAGDTANADFSCMLSFDLGDDVEINNDDQKAANLFDALIGVGVQPSIGHSGTTYVRLKQLKCVHHYPSNRTRCELSEGY